MTLELVELCVEQTLPSVLDLMRVLRQRGKMLTPGQAKSLVGHFRERTPAEICAQNGQAWMALPGSRRASRDVLGIWVLQPCVYSVADACFTPVVERPPEQPGWRGVGASLVAIPDTLGAPAVPAVPVDVGSGRSSLGF